MNWRSHGANPKKIYKQFNIDVSDEIVDFSTNTNVLEPDFDLDFDIKSIISNYPDDESIKLRNCISDKLKIDTNQILVTNGSNAAIYMIVSLYEKIAVLQPTYSEYIRAAKASGKETINISSLGQMDFSADLLIICNPNNPTGKYYEAKELMQILLKCKQNKCDVIIDEAYADFLLVNHKMIDVSIFENVYILKSMTKIYHLSGIRLGYVIACESKISALKKKQPTWSVNALAQEIGLIFMKATDFLQKTRKYYLSETSRFIKQIKQLGYKTMPTSVHYFLMETNDDEAIIRYLLKKGLVVRHTRNFVGLDGKNVRICTREKKNNDRLIAALNEYRCLK